MNTDAFDEVNNNTRLPNMNYMIVGSNTLNGLLKDDKHFWYYEPTLEYNITENIETVVHIGLYCAQMSKYNDDGVSMPNRLTFSVLYASDVYMYENDWENWKKQHPEEYKVWGDKIKEQYDL